MVWYSHLLQNFPQFVVIHIVKGFSIVNEVPVLWHFPSLGLEWKLTFLLLFNITFIIVLFSITFIKVTYARVLYLTVPTSQVALVKNTPANAEDIRDMDLIPESWRAPWRRAWQPTSVFLPGEFCGQRSLAGYNQWGHKESDRTERHTHTHIKNEKPRSFKTEEQYEQNHKDVLWGHLGRDLYSSGGRAIVQEWRNHSRPGNLQNLGSLSHFHNIH